MAGCSDHEQSTLTQIINPVKNAGPSPRGLSGLHGFRMRSVTFSFALGRLVVARGGQIFL
jgi:hypothetical protein